MPTAEYLNREFWRLGGGSIFVWWVGGKFGQFSWYLPGPTSHVTHGTAGPLCLSPTVHSWSLVLSTGRFCLTCTIGQVMFLRGMLLSRWLWECSAEWAEVSATQCGHVCHHLLAQHLQGLWGEGHERQILFSVWRKTLERPPWNDHWHGSDPTCVVSPGGCSSQLLKALVSYEHGLASLRASVGLFFSSYSVFLINPDFSANLACYSH
jgi:hypothetical protein